MKRKNSIPARTCEFRHQNQQAQIALSAGANVCVSIDPTQATPDKALEPRSHLRSHPSLDQPIAQLVVDPLLVWKAPPGWAPSVAATSRTLECRKTLHRENAAGMNRRRADQYGRVPCRVILCITRLNP
jgi:hypothetical protein